MNPIEHLWVVLKRKLNAYENKRTSVHDLWERVQEEWNKTSRETCIDLIESMPRRVKEVLKVKGRYTKY